MFDAQSVKQDLTVRDVGYSLVVNRMMTGVVQCFTCITDHGCERHTPPHNDCQN